MPLPGPYTVGATITLEVTLTDPDTGLPIDANDITCRVQPPGVAVVPVAPVTKFADGVYRARYPMIVAGEHWYEFASASLGMQREGAFAVEASRVT